MDYRREPGQIIAFSHIPKTAGQTLRHLLRQNFGIRHADVFHRTKKHPNVYRAADLRKDLRVYPWAVSIAGHGILVGEDFGELESRLLRYTFLRDPVKRFLSQYQYRCQLRGQQVPFEEWARSRPFPNYHVRWLSGGQDLELAKANLVERCRAVGWTSEFNASLLILRHRLGIPDFQVAYEGARNRGKKTQYGDEVRANWERYEPLVLECNALDMELFEFFRAEVWPRQVAEYGEERLKRDLETEFAPVERTWPRDLRYVTNMAYRTVIYRPLARIDKGAPLR